MLFPNLHILLFSNSVPFSKQSKCNISTFQGESYSSVSRLIFMFNGMCALGETAKGFSLELRLVFALHFHV